MYNIEIHKVLKNGPKDKNYTIIGKRKTRRIQIYKGANPKMQPKMTSNNLNPLWLFVTNSSLIITGGLQAAQNFS